MKLVKYDLHGYTYDLAYAKTKELLMLHKKEKEITIEIVCGKGQGIVRTAVEDCLGRYFRKQYVWHYPVYGLNINTGILVVKKRG